MYEEENVEDKLPTSCQEFSSDLPDEAKNLTVFELAKAKALPQVPKALPSPGICGYEVKKHESRYAKHDSVKLF